MASGVTVSDCVLTCFTNMKVHRSNEGEDRKKVVIFCLSPDMKQIVVEEGKEILERDVSAGTDPLSMLINLLPPNDCRYILYDASFETKESKKQELVFIFWAPDSAPLKSKMVYASSKDAIKKKMTGTKHEYQVNCVADLKDRNALAEKIGGKSVISLEGIGL